MQRRRWLHAVSAFGTANRKRLHDAAAPFRVSLTEWFVKGKPVVLCHITSGWIRNT